MHKQLVISISALALIGSLAAPVFAASSTTTAGANAAGSVTTPAADANANVAANTSATLTVNDVSKDQPFGTITFDQTKSPDELSTTLTADQQKELSQRCDVIDANKDMYDNNTQVWCMTYLEWWKKNHPAG